MDINELVAMLTDGLPAEQASVVKAAVERDAVKAKASGLRQQSEYDTLQTRSAALQAELDGAPDKPGTRAYQKWYNDNYKAIEKLQVDLATYQQKYGTLEAPTQQTQQVQQQQVPPAQQYTEFDIQRMVDKRIQEGYAPRWSDLLTSTGTVVQRHMLAGRKNPIDFKALSDLAQKHSGNLEAAYDEWDKPEREKTAKEQQDKEIDRRVTEELQKRGASAQFPASADLTPGTLSGRTKGELDKFDRPSMERDLASLWVANSPGNSGAA